MVPTTRNLTAHPPHPDVTSLNYFALESTHQWSLTLAQKSGFFVIDQLPIDKETCLDYYFPIINSMNSDGKVQLWKTTSSCLDFCDWTLDPFDSQVFLFGRLTHSGQVAHICIGKLIIIGSDNGLSPDLRQAIIWTNARLLSIEPLGTYFNENLIKIQQFSLKKMHVKMSSVKWRPSCLSLNVLIGIFQLNVCSITAEHLPMAAGSLLW